MANYTMQCKKCRVHTDYSSKSNLCDACEIKSLTLQLSILREALEILEKRGEHYAKDTEMAPDSHFKQGAICAFRCVSGIARSALDKAKDI